MRAVFGTVVYESSYDLYNDFVATINHQSISNFDVLILNDDISALKIQRMAQEIDRNVIVIENNGKLTPQELRIELIQQAKERNYDLLIIGDFDDVFSENRVYEISKNYDPDYCFFYNELYYLNTKENFFGILPAVIEEINPILECNFLGLSNTALNLNKIDNKTLEILKEKSTVAFDWIIYSLLLLRGNKGKRIDGCKTFYRIYKQNTAGENDISIVGLKREIEIKMDHYAKLTDLESIYIELYDFYKNIYYSFEEYSNILLNTSINNNNYWWGRLNMNTLLKEIELYENQK